MRQFEPTYTQAIVMNGFTVTNGKGFFSQILVSRETGNLDRDPNGRFERLPLKSLNYMEEQRTCFVVSAERGP